MLKKRHRLTATWGIFAAVFMISAIFGDGLLYGRQSKWVSAAENGAAAGKPEETGATKTELADRTELVEQSAGESEETSAMKLAEEACSAEEAQETSAPKIELVADEASSAREVEKTGALKTELMAGEVKPAKELEYDSDDTEPSEEQQEKPSVEQASDDTEPAEEHPVAAMSASVDYVIANVDTSLNIRKGASTEDEIVGKLYRGAKAAIVERGAEWTKIASGSVEGFVSSEYLMFDEEAVRGAEIFGVKLATVNVDALRIRKEPGANGGVLDLAEKGEKLTVAETGEDIPSGWVAIDYSDELTGYVSADYVTVEVELEDAISIEEEQRLLEEKRLEEEKAAEAARAAEAAAEAKEAMESAKQNVSTSNRSPIPVSDEDAYMLAALVQMEAGNQCYEGKLAVANVVVNRLLSGKWGGTIRSVLCAPGQFPGAASGLLQRYMDQGPNDGSLKAAAEALAGVNNVGNYMSFCSNRVAKYSSYSNYTIIGDHCFYNR